MYCIYFPPPGTFKRLQLYLWYLTVSSKKEKQQEEWSTVLTFWTWVIFPVVRCKLSSTFLHLIKYRHQVPHTFPFPFRHLADAFILRDFHYQERQESKCTLVQGTRKTAIKQRKKNKMVSVKTKIKRVLKISCIYVLWRLRKLLWN